MSDLVCSKCHQELHAKGKYMLVCQRCKRTQLSLTGYSFVCGMMGLILACFFAVNIYGSLKGSYVFKCDRAVPVFTGLAAAITGSMLGGLTWAAKGSARRLRIVGNIYIGLQFSCWIIAVIVFQH